MNKQESKYFYTASLFDDALIELLEKKDINYITIKELCDKAGVNRSTFYLHYESINDLLDETMQYILNKFLKKFNKNPEEFISNIDNLSLNDLNFINKEYLSPYLEFIKENRKIYLAYLNNSITLKALDSANNLSEYVLEPIMSKFGIPERDRKYWMVFGIKGITAIIELWIKNDCVDEIEYIEKIIIDCIRPNGEK